MERTINIKAGARHQTLEFLIKREDTAQDMSRAAVFERAVNAAKSIQDWKEVQILLSDLPIENDAPAFSNYQAKYNENTETALQEIRKSILNDLKETGLKVLQTQYLVLLLYTNYLSTLRKRRLTIRGENINEDDIDLPEMSKLFCTLMLEDKDSDALLQIKKIF